MWRDVPLEGLCPLTVHFACLACTQQLPCCCATWPLPCLAWPRHFGLVGDRVDRTCCLIPFAPHSLQLCSPIPPAAGLTGNVLAWASGDVRGRQAGREEPATTSPPPPPGRRSDGWWDGMVWWWWWIKRVTLSLSIYTKCHLHLSMLCLINY